MRRVRKSSPAALMLLCLGAGFATRAWAQGLAISGGSYAATLGAGAATGEDRAVFGGNPAAMRSGGFGLALDWQRPYGIPDLSVADAGAYRDAGRFGVAAHWRDTGVDGLFRSEDFEGTIAFRLIGTGRRDRSGKIPGGRLMIGYSLLGSQSEIYGETKTFAARQGLGAIWQALPTLAVGGFLRDLELFSRKEKGSPASERVLQFGATARTGLSGSGGTGVSGSAGAGQSISLDFRKNGNSPWKTLAALTLSPHPALSISVGVAGPPFQASLGVGLNFGGVRFLQALRYHRYLGQTWLSGVQFNGGD